MSASARWAELIGGPFRAAWRSGLAWAVTFAFFIVATVAFWPVFKGSAALNDALKVLPSAMLEAFGLQDFASPAGYLRGGLYDVLIPLMFAAAGAMFANSATSAEEDAGRLELYVAQPVTRMSVMTGRAISTALWLAVLVVVVLVSQIVSDVLFDLQIETGLIVATIVLCGLLGLVFAALAILLAGLFARPGIVLGVTLGVALVGYVVAALFPISDLLKPWAAVSPWDWAFAGDPLVSPTELWRYAALGLPALVLFATGIFLFDRRDIRSA